MSRRICLECECDGLVLLGDALRKSSCWFVIGELDLLSCWRAVLEIGVADLDLLKGEALYGVVPGVSALAAVSALPAIFDVSALPAIFGVFGVLVASREFLVFCSSRSPFLCGSVPSILIADLASVAELSSSGRAATATDTKHAASNDTASSTACTRTLRRSTAPSKEYRCSTRLHKDIADWNKYSYYLCLFKYQYLPLLIYINIIITELNSKLQMQPLISAASSIDNSLSLLQSHILADTKLSHPDASSPEAPSQSWSKEVQVLSDILANTKHEHLKAHTAKDLVCAIDAAIAHFDLQIEATVLVLTQSSHLPAKPTKNIAEDTHQIAQDTLVVFGTPTKPHARIAATTDQSTPSLESLGLSLQSLQMFAEPARRALDFGSIGGSSVDSPDLRQFGIDTRRKDSDGSFLAEFVMSIDLDPLTTVVQHDSRLELPMAD